MKWNSVFLCDIDGTLVGKDMVLLKEVKEAVDSYMNSDGKLILCTGRSWIATRKIKEDLNLTDPLIVYNGAAIYDPEKDRIIWKETLDQDVLKAVGYIYENFPEVSIQIFTDKDIYRLRTNWMIETYGVPEERGTEIKDVSMIEGEILKLSFTANHRADLEKCQKLHFWEKYRYEYSSRHFSEVVAKHTGKHVAAKQLLKVLKINEEKIFAAGNGMNDLKMLQLSHCSFAPEDAAKEVREISNMVIDSPEKGGIRQAFELADQYNQKVIINKRA